MNSSNFNMRLDDGLRARAYPVFEQYGLTPSQAVRMFFNQVASTGKVPLSFDWAERVPNAQTQAAIAELENGGGRLTSLDELLMERQNAAD